MQYRSRDGSSSSPSADTASPPRYRPPVRHSNRVNQHPRHQRPGNQHPGHVQSGHVHSGQTHTHARHEHRHYNVGSDGDVWTDLARCSSSVCEYTLKGVALAWNTTNEFLNRISRPRWTNDDQFKPYAIRSYDIGGYEYEVMVCRRPLSFCEKLCEAGRRECTED